MRRALPVAILIALTLIALTLVVPGAANACAVCGAAVDRNQSLFLGTTILLSLLPLGLIAAGLWWIARHAGGHLAAELEDRELPADAPRGPAGGAGA